MDNVIKNIIQVGKVSVIMGIYNCASTLSEAIESILSQTYKNWNLIMCDDGSSDETYKVADSYREIYPEKIKLIRHEKNKGLNVTLNDCLELADGEFIARMDGDDLCLPERFEVQVSLLRKHKEFSFVSSPMIYFDENGEWGKGKAIEKPIAKDFIRGCPFCHAPAMVRIEAYRAVHGYSLDKYTKRCEDADLWARMYSKGYLGYNLQLPYYKMRDDRNAISRRKFKYAINAFLTRINIAHMLHLPIIAYVFSLRPIIVSLLPYKLYKYLHRKGRKNRL